MCGWVHLPRFIDKIRLHLAGNLHPDYQPNFTKGFDGRWLAAAGVKQEAFIDLVRDSIIDGQVVDWVRVHVQCPEETVTDFNQFVLNRGNDDPDARSRLEQRKRECGLGHRADITTFVELIEADEGRL